MHHIPVLVGILSIFWLSTSPCTNPLKVIFWLEDIPDREYWPESEYGVHVNLLIVRKDICKTCRFTSKTANCDEAPPFCQCWLFSASNLWSCWRSWTAHVLSLHYSNGKWTKIQTKADEAQTVWGRTNITVENGFTGLSSTAAAEPEHMQHILRSGHSVIRLH